MNHMQKMTMNNGTKSNTKSKNQQQRAAPAGKTVREMVAEIESRRRTTDAQATPKAAISSGADVPVRSLAKLYSGRRSVSESTPGNSSNNRARTTKLRRSLSVCSVASTVDSSDAAATDEEGQDMDDDEEEVEDEEAEGDDHADDEVADDDSEAVEKKEADTIDDAVVLDAKPATVSEHEDGKHGDDGINTACTIIVAPVAVAVAPAARGENASDLRSQAGAVTAITSATILAGRSRSASCRALSYETMSAEYQRRRAQSHAMRANLGNLVVAAPATQAAAATASRRPRLSQSAPVRH